MDTHRDAHPALVAAESRFLAKVYRSPNSGHWFWTGSRNRDGYGLFRCKGYRAAAIPAHRVAHMLYVGPLDDGLEVDHLCMVRSCVNPAHLRAMTKTEHRRMTRKRANERKRAAWAALHGGLQTRS